MVVDTSNTRTDIGTAEHPPDAERRVGEGDQLGRAVVATVAEAHGRDPMEIPPLHDTVDLDALETLFGSQYDGTPRTGGRVAFVHGECEVVVEPGVVRAYRG
ncbi:hypothetical protein NGM10_10095 [Halorussus salilacus]|uniref:HalOD1 output domain-containing protein n=1 Tax=Halorussus salilacus TaxID=2953750 RepID=UPI0020A07C73|nr:HalOD1 output domain-containing protein [Halorussus salilacus]USZ67081.1 hypothetical protein NGM10_10095 [Halorussus salilacus]